MEIETQWDNEGRLLVTCIGDVGWDERESLPKRVISTVDDKQGEDSAPKVLIDLEQVDFINSAGVGALFQLYKQVSGREGKLVMAKVPPVLKQLFETVALDRHVPMAASLDEGRRLLEE